MNLLINKLYEYLSLPEHHHLISNGLWSTIEKDKRMSFLNYYFIIYKLLELMGQTELMLQVPLLKTKLRIKQHDSLWQKVCDSLEWTWKPTEMIHQARPRAPKRKPKVALPEPLFIEK